MVEFSTITRETRFDSWSVHCLIPGQCIVVMFVLGFPGGSDGQESACHTGDLGWEGPLEKEMTTHSSSLAWRIPWTERHGKLQSKGISKSLT